MRRIVVKKVLKPVICLFVIAALLSLVSVPSAEAGGQAFLKDLSRAKGNLKFGPKSRLHLGLEVQERWDDNVYYTSSDEKEDFISTVTPGLLISLGNRYKLEAGYAYGMNIYSKYTDENYNDNIARARIKLDFPVGLTFDVSDEYLDTKDARTEEDAKRASHWTNDVSASVAYIFPAKKLAVEVVCTELYLKYHQTENEATNRKEDACGMGVYYRFLPKTSALIQYDYTMNDYFDSASESTDADSTSNAVNVGFRWDPTAKLSGKFTTGWKKRVYSNSNIYDDQDLWAVHGNLFFKATERTGLNIDMDRSIQETVYGGSVEYSQAAHYIKTGGGIGLEQKLGVKFTLDAGATYNKHEYSNLVSGLAQRQDDVTTFNAGFDYAINKWLSTSLKYSYSGTSSNDSNKDEIHNKVFLTVSTTL